MKNLRISCVTSKSRGLDLQYNTDQIILEIKKAKENNIELVIFPELAITTSMVEDYFLLEDVKKAVNIKLEEIINETENIYVLIGSTYYKNGKLFNVALLINDKQIVKIVQKNSTDSINDKYFHNEKEFDMEKTQNSIYTLKNGVDLAICFSLQNIENINCDLVAVLHNGLYDIIEYNGYLKLLKEVSLNNDFIIATAMPSFQASTTDLISISKNSIVKNGCFIKEAVRFENVQISADISDDLGAEIQYSPICKEAKMSKPFSDICMPDFDIIYEIQVCGLMQRIKVTNSEKILIGVSGGLDSTLALLVACSCADKLKIDRKNVVAITMPCFGTSKRTKDNAEILAKELKVDFKIIDITESVLEHFKTICHEVNVYDTAYENAQARERMQVLMDLANMCNGLVVGTGDLSELALGWTTYNGDHMSNYSVNASIPKSLMQDMIEHIAEKENNKKLKECLKDIISTPISPELLPHKKGEIQQKTEVLLGPYEFYDFILYYGIYLGLEIRTVYDLAIEVFGSKLSKNEVIQYMKRFYQRFVTQQFKRSCLPDGPMATFFSLSPRKGFEIPSDASCSLFLDQLNSLV